MICVGGEGTLRTKPDAMPFSGSRYTQHDDLAIGVCPEQVPYYRLGAPMTYLTCCQIGIGQSSMKRINGRQHGVGRNKLRAMEIMRISLVVD